MGTANFNWPTPLASSPPDVPGDIKRLADAADATVKALQDLLDVPVAQMRQTVSQPIANNLFTTVTWDAEDVDNKGGHDTSSNTSRYVSKRAGWYELKGKVTTALSATNARGGRWLKNGAEINGSQIMAGNAGPTLPTLLPVQTIAVLLALNDYVELQVYQDSGGTLGSAVSGSQQPTMTVTFLRDP